MKKLFSLVLAIAFIGLANTFAQCSYSKKASSASAKANCSKVCSKTASTSSSFDFVSLEEEGFSLKQCSNKGTYSATKTCGTSGKVTEYNQCGQSGKITKTIKNKDGLILSREIVSGGKEIGTKAATKASCSKTASKASCSKTASKASCSKTAKKGCCAKKAGTTSAVKVN